MSAASEARGKGFMVPADIDLDNIDGQIRPDLEPGPQRFRLSRAKGYRLPEGVVNVARPTRWGNPFEVGQRVQVDGVMSGSAAGLYNAGDPRSFSHLTTLTARLAVDLYEQSLREELAEGDDDGSLAVALEALRGKHLACWCPLDAPCHADVLLRMANEERR